MTSHAATLFHSHQSYSLSLPSVPWPVSVLSVKGKEKLNQLWHYEIIFACVEKDIPTEWVLSQGSTLCFNTSSFLSLPLGVNDSFRFLNGVIVEFTLLKTHKEETHYRVVLMPHMVLLDKHTHCAIYQYKNVIDTVKSVLIHHGFSDVDYHFELQEVYPVRECITQWQETDWHFIQRILAEVGIWLRWQYDDQIQQNCLILSDYEGGYFREKVLTYKPTSGLTEDKTFCVWDMQIHGRMVEKGIRINDYNYCEADVSLHCTTSETPESSCTYGWDYRCNEYYLKKGNKTCPESGFWYAIRRHQASLTKQYLITGKSNDYTLSPGQHIHISNPPFPHSFKEGVIILSVEGRGNRSDSYQIEFTAIPYNATRPYRPSVPNRPYIRGTLPAVIVSPDNDIYGYLDTQGRYRVHFDFNLGLWQTGHERAWIRLAKPYSGHTYGFHFPLLTGTEVAIGFMGGNPDRPYIAYAMHNAKQRDLVTLENKHRNILRTAAHNTLRMDDKHGEEHIKIATEFAKTQLNLGHLVDSKKGKRGMGFELRTNQYGTVIASKGIYLTTGKSVYTQSRQRQMEAAKLSLENALQVATGLKNVAQLSGAHTANIQEQSDLKRKLNELDQNAMLAFGEKGVALVSNTHLQISSGKNNAIIAERNVNMSVRHKVILCAKEALSFLARKSGLKIAANKGKVDISAVNDSLSLGAKKTLLIESTHGKMTLPAAKEIILVSGGSYLKITEAGVELGTSGNITVKSAGLEKVGATSTIKR